MKPKPQDPAGQTLFDLFLEDLKRSCWLTPDQVSRAEGVSATWGRHLIRMPSHRHWTRRAARHAACRLLLLGEEVAVVRDRLQVMGLSRRSAYRVIAQARADIEQHAGAAHG